MIVYLPRTTFSLVKGCQRIHVEKNRTARLQNCVELAEHLLSLGGTEGAEIAHEHEDQAKAIICLEFQIVLIFVVDGQPLGGCDFLCVLNRPLREIYSGHIRPSLSQPRRIQSRPAAEVGYLSPGADVEVRSDPFD